MGVQAPTPRPASLDQRAPKTTVEWFDRLCKIEAEQTVILQRIAANLGTLKLLQIIAGACILAGILMGIMILGAGVLAAG